jgi:polysaccharide biosynthesis protein PslG
VKVRRLLAGLITAGLLAGCGLERGSANDGPSGPESAPPSAAAPQYADYRGFAIGDAWNGMSETQLAMQATRARSLGSEVLRIDIEWGRIRPNEHGPYDWAEVDRRLKIAKDTGQIVMATLAYAPEWARDDACKDEFTCEPDNPNEFNDFATEFAHHVSGSELELENTVKFVEIWNEQNNDKIDPEKYARMLSLASESIHNILQDAKVGFGGMAPNAETEGGTMTAPDYLRAVNKYLREKERKQPKDVYDAVSFHPYGYPARPDQPYIWNGMTQTEGDPSVSDVPNLHAVMVTEGIGGMEVWLNEFGAPTCGSVKVSDPEDPNWNEHGGVTAEYQKDLIMRFLNWKFKHMNVTVRLLHTLQDRDSDSPDREKCFGAYDDQGNLKIPGLALR